LRRFFFLVVFGSCLLGASSASAQEATRWQVFGGYSHAHVDISTDVPFADPSYVGLNGFNAAFAGHFNRWIGVVSDFGGYYTNQPVSFIQPGSGRRVTEDVRTHVYMLLFGPQVRFPMGRVTPFARAMVGLFHTSEEAALTTTVKDMDNDRGIAFGGGVDATVNERIAVRVVQMDYVRSYLTPIGSQNNWRISTGIVMRMGSELVR
jgi:opacity protein-like surface antigen